MPRVTKEGWEFEAMPHVSQTELLDELDAADTDAVSVFGSERMTVGLKRYSEETASDKGSREHARDELYYVLSGAGTMSVDGTVHAVAAGDLVYVEEGASHDIVDVAEELTVVKVFTK